MSNAAERNGVDDGTVRGRAPDAPSSPRRYRRRLANLLNVRTALADVIRQVDTGELADMKRARTLIYGLSVLAGVIQGTDLEARLEALEAKGAPQVTP